MLMPYMMEEMGYRMVDTGIPSEANIARRAELESQISALESQPSFETVFSTGPGGFPIEQRVEVEDSQEKKSQIKLLRDEFEGIGEGSRQLERIPWEERMAGMDPQQRKAYELHDAYLDRQLSAIKGELPVSPALERDIKEQRGLMTEDLSRRLGPSYKQSTAGVQTEAKFTESANIAKESARQGIIGQGEGLRSSISGDLGRGSQSRVAGLAGAPQTFYAGVGAGGAALQPYQYQRGLESQAGMQTAANRAGRQAGLMTLAGMGAYALSSKEYKEDIKEIDGKEGDNVLEMVKKGKTFTYDYKKGKGPKGRRIGLITEHAPKQVVSPDGKMLDIPQEVGMLRTATKALAKKVDKMKRRA